LVYPDPSALGRGTDWQDAIFNSSARRTNHQVSLSGGGDKSLFYASLGYQNTEGIVATEISNFEQFNVRLNSTHKISKVFTVSQTLGYTHSKSMGIGNVNSEFGGPLSSAINLDPITPIFETDPAKLANASLYPAHAVRDANGNVFGISQAGVQEMSNPLAYIQTRLGRYNWDDNFVGNISLEAAITDEIKFKSVFSGKVATWGDEGFTPVHFLGSGGGLNVQVNNLTRNLHERKNWNIENYITYTNSFGEHDVSLLVGQGVYVENLGVGSSFTLTDLPVNDYHDASFGFYTESSVYTASAYTTDGNLNNNIHKLASFFGRVSYAYQEKFLFIGVLRADGSNRFGTNNRYGVFPVASIGWNISIASFWAINDVLNYVKLRAGFVVTGNDGI